MDKQTELKLIKEYKAGTILTVQDVNLDHEIYNVKLTKSSVLLIGGWATLDNNNIVRVICRAHYTSNKTYIESGLTNIPSDEISYNFRDIMKFKYVVMTFCGYYNYRDNQIVDCRSYVYQQNMNNYIDLKKGDIISTRYRKSDEIVEYGIACVSELTNDVDLNNYYIFTGEIEKWN